VTVELELHAVITKTIESASVIAINFFIAILLILSAFVRFFYCRE